MSQEPCWTCKQPVDIPRAKLCNDCWEVERRIEQYLYRGGETAMRFVQEKIDAYRNTR